MQCKAQQEKFKNRVKPFTEEERKRQERKKHERKRKIQQRESRRSYEHFQWFIRVTAPDDPRLV